MAVKSAGILLYKREGGELRVLPRPPRRAVLGQEGRRRLVDPERRI